jgi:MFS superfamily sulfate permease-like transporter
MLFKYWKSDVQSSLVVFLVALPLCLGIALASGAPMAAGLYAGIIGGLVVGSLSGSHISVSGPAAGLTVIVIGAIQSLGSFQAFTLAVFISGFIQIAFSLFKGGAIGDYFPSSVIKGMLAAIGIILILKQFPHAIGFDASFMGSESFNEAAGENTFSQLLMALKSVHPGAVVISLLSMALMMSWEKMALKGVKFFQFIPGALVAVLLSIVINVLFGFISTDLVISGDHLVSLPFTGGLSDFVSGFAMPDWSFLSNVKIYTVALTLALVGSLESLLSIDAADKIDESGRATDKNRELFAQGVGNSLSGLIGGLPVTAVIVRTSANVSAGAKSKLSAILHGVWLLACVVMIPNLLNMIPLSALAAVLILVGYKLTKIELIKKMYHKGMNQFIPFMITIVAILLTDLLMGIFIGVIAGFIFVLRSNVHKSIVMVKEGNMHLIKFYKDVSFLQKASLQKMFNSIPDGSMVLLDGSNTVFVDEDIVDLIEEFIKRGKNSEITVELKKSSLALCPMFKEVHNG